LIDGDGKFDYIIDETGNNDIVLWIYNGVIVFAQETIQKEEVSEEINEEIDEIDISDEIEETIRDDPNEEIEPGNSPVRTLVYTAVGGSIRIVTHMVGDQIIDYVADKIGDDDDDPQCTLNEGDIDMSVQSTETGTFIAAPSGYKSFNGLYEETANPVETELRCVDDRDAVIDTYADDPTDITDGSLGENVSVEFVNERGLDLEWPEDGFDEGDASEIGPDIIAYDEDANEWLIIEAKTTTSTDAVGIGLLQTDAYDGDPQLSDEWILNSLEELNATDKIDEEFVQDIEDALDQGAVRKEVVLVRDVEGASERTLRQPARPSTDISLPEVVGVDQVTIVELQAGEPTS